MKLISGRSDRLGCLLATKTAGDGKGRTRISILRKKDGGGGLVRKII